MTTALALNAESTLSNGHGLSQSPALDTEIQKYLSFPSVKILGNLLYSVYQANAHVTGQITSIIGTIGQGISKGKFLIDMYPNTSLAVCTANVVTYANTITYDGEGTILSRTPILDTASVSKTLQLQATLPFQNGIKGFANIYSRAYSASSQSFETTASVAILKDKTYADSGLGFTGPADVATNGIGANGKIISSTVSNWGKMFNINNFVKYGDPYVFGQYLINQRLGKYGLQGPMIAAGLDISNLGGTTVSSSYETQQSSTTSASTLVGSVDLPSLKTVTEVVKGSTSSVDTIRAIYKTVTDANLASIITSTGITNLPTSIKSLDDFLYLDRVVSSDILEKLKSIGITDHASLGKYLQTTVGKGSFSSWADLGKLLAAIEVPKVAYTTSKATDKVISTSTVSTLTANNATGSGSLGHSTIKDFLGSCAGIPYTELFKIVNDNYYLVASSKTVEQALKTLDSAVTTYINSSTFNAYSDSWSFADSTPVQKAVTAVNSALSAITDSTSYTAANLAYNTIIQQLYSEVTNCRKGNVIMPANGDQTTLNAFAQQFVNGATDKLKMQTYQFFANITTNDQYGDTLRAAIAEAVNLNLLSGAGIVLSNDPQPSLALQQADSQNIPITTYLSRNK